MPSSGQRKKLLLDLAMYFAERGEICSPREFNLDRGNRPAMIKSSTVNNYFGSWSGMVKQLKLCHSDILDSSKKKEEPVSFHDPLADYFESKNIKAEPDPLAALRASSIEK